MCCERCDRLARIMDLFMVGLLNSLTGTVNTRPDAPHVRALNQLQELLNETGGAADTGPANQRP